MVNDGKMQKIHGHLVGIDQGEVVLFNDYEDNGPMWAETGERSVIKEITFSESFDEPPSTTVRLAMCDMSNDAYMRLDLRVEDVTRKGFKIRFNTWGDTKIARLRVAWQAIGSVSSDDAWDI